MSTAAAKSTAAAIRTATKSLPATTTTGLQHKPTKLFTINFDPHPTSALNTLSYNQTRLIASDPSHPLYIRTQRRLASFDPTKLHWTVKAPVSLSRKPVVRNWAVRRVKEAFRAELKVGGWSGDGSVIGSGSGSGVGVGGERRGLSGALCIHLGKDGAVLLANGEEVRAQCRWLVGRVVEMQGKTKMKKKGGDARSRVVEKKEGTHVGGSDASAGRMRYSTANPS